MPTMYSFMCPSHQPPCWRKLRLFNQRSRVSEAGCKRTSYESTQTKRIVTSSHLNGLLLLLSCQTSTCETFGSKFTVRIHFVVSSTCRSAYQQIRMLSHIRKSINKNSAELLSNALILSRIDFCISLVSSTSRYNLNRLQRILNHAAKVVTLKRKSDHVTPISQQLKWLNVDNRIKKKKVIFAYNAVNGYAPTYLCRMVTPYVPNRTLRSQSANLLQPHHVKREIGKISFRFWAADVWNALETEARTSRSLGKILRLAGLNNSS